MNMDSIQKLASEKTASYGAGLESTLAKLSKGNGMRVGAAAAGGLAGGAALTALIAAAIKRYRAAKAQPSEKTASAYEIGFCKYAESQGIDPKILARVLLLKEAQAAGAQGVGLWDYVRSQLKSVTDAARGAWHSVPTQYKPLAGALVGAGGGALGGAAIGGLSGIGARRGALLGAGLGGVGGGLYGANSMAKYLAADKAKALKGKDEEIAKHLAALKRKDKEIADAAAKHLADLLKVKK